MSHYFSYHIQPFELHPVHSGTDELSIDAVSGSTRHRVTGMIKFMARVKAMDMSCSSMLRKHLRGSIWRTKDCVIGVGVDTSTVFHTWTELSFLISHNMHSGPFA